MTKPNRNAAPRVRRLSLAGMRFRNKLTLLPATALIGFMAILFVSMTYSSENSENLEQIQNAYLPTLQASRDLEEILGAVQQGLQDAAAAEDAESLNDTDALRDSFLEGLAKVEAAGIHDADDVNQLRALFTAYYSLARNTTETMISGDMSDRFMERLGEMQAKYNEIKATLEEGTVRDNSEMEAAFANARNANDMARWVSIIMIFVSMIVMSSISFYISRSAIGQLKLVADGFERMGQGDFSTPVAITSADELGDLGKQVNSTSRYLTDLVREIRQTATEVNSSAAEMSATANQHQQGATEQSSAVDETQRTMQSILTSTEQINAATDMVLRNAELTQGKNQLISESIVSLSAHTDRITEVLSTIKDIANRTELLALNAALEGTKAGEVGRGFSLVATQMQRLAENVQHAVGNIRTLTESIRKATGSSVIATEEGTKLAGATTSSAREIRLAMQQHQTGTQQVSRAMDDVAQVAQQSAASSRQILASSEDLATFSERLLSMTARFTLSERESSDSES